MGIRDYITAKERVNFKMKNKGNSVLVLTLLIVSILPFLILLNQWSL